MRSLDSATAAAIAKDGIETFDLVRIAGRDRSDNSITYANLWTGIGTVTVPVIDAITQTSVDRDFVGAGSLLNIDPLAFVSEQQITIRTLRMGLSQINEAVINLVRGYDLHGQEVQVYEAYLNPTTMNIVAPAQCWFFGFVDTVSINTPQSGNDGSVDIEVRSHTAAMTRVSNEKRSHASEVLRHAGDGFYKDTDVCHKWNLPWGINAPDTQGGGASGGGGSSKSSFGRSNFS